MNFNWIRTALLAATAMVSLNSFSQDLIARQAPIDRKLKSVDSLALQKQIRAEQSLYPGLDLYPDKPVHIRLIPYYAWGNRGKAEMTVWMPLARTNH